MNSLSAVIESDTPAAAILKPMIPPMVSLILPRSNLLRISASLTATPDQSKPANAPASASQRVSTSPFTASAKSSASMFVIKLLIALPIDLPISNPLTSLKNAPAPLNTDESALPAVAPMLPKVSGVIALLIVCASPLPQIWKVSLIVSQSKLSVIPLIPDAIAVPRSVKLNAIPKPNRLRNTVFIELATSLPSS